VSGRDRAARAGGGIEDTGEINRKLSRVGSVFANAWRRGLFLRRGDVVEVG
jgi:hypothetical protein